MWVKAPFAPGYKYSIEPFISEETSPVLEDLYESSFSTKEYAQIFHPGTKKYTFTLVEDGSTIRQVVLFERVGNRLNVLNKVCRIPSLFVAYFCSRCFEKFPGVRIISFEKQREKPDLEGLPYIITQVNGDFVIPLPGSPELYHASLGSKTRRNVNNPLHHLKRDFPDFNFFVLEKEEIPYSLVEETVGLNRKRMKEKGAAPGLKDRFVRQFVAFAKQYGFAGVIQLNGQTAAAALGARVGGHLYCHVLAHDPAFNTYRLGLVCIYLTIMDFIGKGGETFHLLWGDCDYKHKLNAEKTTLYSYEVLRYSYLRPWRIFMNWVKRNVEVLRGITLKKIRLHLQKRMVHIGLNSSESRYDAA